MNSNNLEFTIGTWVFYNNPSNSQYHGMLFQVQKLIPMKDLNPNPKGHKGYRLVYGQRSVDAAHHEMVKKGTPEAKPFETGSYQTTIKGSFGTHNHNPQNILKSRVSLEKLGELKKEFYHTCSEGEFKTPIFESDIFCSCDNQQPEANWAGGDEFYYCKNCKKEVKYAQESSAKD